MCWKSVWGNSVHFKILTALRESPQPHSYLPSCYMPGRHLHFFLSVKWLSRASWSRSLGLLLLWFKIPSKPTCLLSDSMILMCRYCDILVLAYRCLGVFLDNNVHGTRSLSWRLVLRWAFTCAYTLFWELRLCSIWTSPTLDLPLTESGAVATWAKSALYVGHWVTVGALGSLGQYTSSLSVCYERRRKTKYL